MMPAMRDAVTAKSRNARHLAAERRAAIAALPRVAWPTLLMGVVLPASYAAVIVAAVWGVIAAWLATIILGPLAYAHYMLIHESLHHNLRPRGSPLPIVEGLLGRIGALVLLSNWPYARRSHLAHHAHTNTARDPDIFVKGSFGKLLATWLRASPMALIPPIGLRCSNRGRHDRLRTMLTRGEWIEANVGQGVQLLIAMTALVSGWFWPWLLLWFLPGRIGALLLMIFFQWLPHHPHEDATRYGMGRLSFWPGAEALLLWQNLHLIHHLWPRVPFYRLGRLHREIAPILQAQAVRHEGLWPGSVPR